jgi:hypothetical protein
MELGDGIDENGIDTILTKMNLLLITHCLSSYAYPCLRAVKLFYI